MHGPKAPQGKNGRRLLGRQSFAQELDDFLSHRPAVAQCPLPQPPVKVVWELLDVQSGHDSSVMEDTIACGRASRKSGCGLARQVHGAMFWPVRRVRPLQEAPMNPADFRLVPASTALLVIDVQEKLVPAMLDGGAACVANVERLLEGAKLLGMRTLVTQQYPKGLGPTIANVQQRLEALGIDRGATAQVVDKMEFAATSNAQAQLVLQQWQAQGVHAVLVCGMEAHVCVYQSVRGLREMGFAVHVVRDACASRTAANLEIGAGLWQRCGAVVTSTETVLFDLVGAAGSETFKAISRAIR